MTKAKITALSSGLTFSLFALVALALASLAPSEAWAQMGPDYWRVSGVPANDTLNIRSAAGTGNRVVAVAPNGAIFRNLGCTGSGSSRWCHLESPDGRLSGWASGRYLVESGAPTTGNISGNNDVPELHVRNTGEMEVRFASGCTVLFNPIGGRINAGSSCSSAQLTRAQQAVDGYIRETAGSDGHEGGASANVRVTGTGTIVGGDPLTGTISGHAEGHYALVLSGGGFTCTGALRHAPGTVGSEMSNLHCTNGAQGTAILANKQNGQLLTFNLSNGTAGILTFR